MSSLHSILLSQFLIINSILAIAINQSDNKRNILFKTPELVRKQGYQLEVHNVVTEDGYILEIHRLPCGRNNCRWNAKQPILILHGLAGSSADWILMGPDRSLGYILANAGYDVWLGNNRGNVYSRNHTSILPTDRHFWNFRYKTTSLYSFTSYLLFFSSHFSYHELGIYDLPAMIDYILDRTNNEQLFYIGHSQGSTQFWVTMTQRPSYNAKVKLMIALAPVAFTGNIRGPVTKLAKFTYMGVWIGETFGYPELRSRYPWEKFVSNVLCRDATAQLFCNNLLFLVTGFDQASLSAANVSTIISHIPAGASWKQLIHYGQGYIHPDLFRQFDYDNSKKNDQFYNSPEPPGYELNKVTAPVALFSSENDLLSTKMDIDLLKSKIGNVVYHNEVSIKSFSHYDFLWGTSSIQIIYEPILKLLTLYK
ncbi:Gastric triacylglycerol lipase [Anthophora retusa]